VQPWRVERSSTSSGAHVTLTRRKLALLLGAVAYLAAWAFGSRPLYPVALGVLLAVLLSWAWIRLATGPATLRRIAGRGDETEGSDVKIELLLELESRVPPPSVVLVERIGRLGERETPLERTSRGFEGRYTLERVPRGCYSFAEAEVVLGDPFGLERTVLPVRGGGAVLVYPRLVEVERVFSEAGAHAQDGRRLLLRRPSGFDFHSVREHEEGESLRMVHWRTTARRGQLMVKELEDAPRDEVAVVLDGDAQAVVGESFDVQVRAAGSILRAHVRHSRRCVLVVNSAAGETRQVHSEEGDWRLALELLAAVEPTGTRPVWTLLEEEAGPAGRALEIALVTARLSPALVDRLVQRALGRRGVSLVYVDASSFNGVPQKAEPSLLRLQAVGIPIAVCRRDDDLAQRLSAPALAGRTSA
jgi:uncharacterized protein (DUF58 family)